MLQPWNNFFLMVIMIWIQVGFAMVVLSAAIKAIPMDVVEAAELDGATGWKLFSRVTIPMIRGTLIVVSPRSSSSPSSRSSTSCAR